MVKTEDIQYDCCNRLNLDSAAFVAPNSYGVAVNFDGAYVATVNFAESDAAATSATSAGVTAA